MDLKKIWKNRKEIYEGIKNSVIRDNFVEDISAKRMAICIECPSKGNECEVPGAGPCCNKCGCSLTFKTRALSTECPLGKWKAIMTENEEDKLDEL